jgi:hypothetical protein
MLHALINVLAVCISSQNNSWRKLVTFKLQQFFPWGKTPRQPLAREWTGPTADLDAPDVPNRNETLVN